MFRDEYGCAVGFNQQAGGSSQPVLTVLLSSNWLLQAGLTQLLTATRFAVADISARAVAPLVVQEGQIPALYIVDANELSQQTLEFVQAAKVQHPATRVVAIANKFDVASIQQAMAAGVNSFCLATGNREVLVNILELTMLGETILPGTVLQVLLDQTQSVAGAGQIAVANEQTPPDPRVNKLSPREAVILHSLMGGDPNKVIARKLDITEATIKVHVKSILRKIGAANRTQAALWAVQNLGLTDRPSLSN